MTLEEACKVITKCVICGPKSHNPAESERGAIAVIEGVRSPDEILIGFRDDSLSGPFSKGQDLGDVLIEFATQLQSDALYRELLA